MISRRRLLLIGLLLFLGGLIVPCLIGFVAEIMGAEENLRYHLLYYSCASGIVIAILMGGPLMVIGIFTKHSEKRE